MAEASEHWPSCVEVLPTADRTDFAARDNLRYQGDLLLVHDVGVSLAHLSFSTKPADCSDCRSGVIEVVANSLLSSLRTSTCADLAS